jgi:predicted nucleic acid-binding protein
MKRKAPPVVLDTNVFVAALFNPGSDAGRILDAVRRGNLRMVWSDPTRRETRRILEQIPPLSWSSVSDLFREEDRHAGRTHPEAFGQIPDREDRKFAALAYAVGAILVTQDEHLLATPHRLAVLVLTPGELRSGARDVS